MRGDRRAAPTMAATVGSTAYGMRLDERADCRVALGDEGAAVEQRGALEEGARCRSRTIRAPLVCEARDGGVERSSQPGDRPAAARRARRRGRRAGRRAAIGGPGAPGAGADHHRDRGLGLGHGAREDAHAVERARRRHDAVGRDETERRLEADDAVERGRDRPEPAVSVPTPRSAMPSATATAEPELDPPPTSSGTRVRTTPYGERVPTRPVANWSRLVLPSTTAPAATSRATAGAVRLGQVGVLGAAGRRRQTGDVDVVLDRDDRPASGRCSPRREPRRRARRRQRLAPRAGA